MPNQLTNSYQQISNRILNNTGKFARQAFIDLGSWRDDDVERYLKTIEAPLAGAKKLVSNLQLAHYREAAKQSGRKFSAPKISNRELVTAELRNGVDTRTVYTRPFVELRTALSQGKTLTESIEAGARRSESLATTEVELARRISGYKARERNSNIVGYLRVLSGFENCALCEVASTNRYSHGDLMPIHSNCDCGEEPIYSDYEPEPEPEFEDDSSEDLDQRFSSFDYGNDPESYAKAIVVRQHGELGPVLTVKGQHFRGPAEAKRLASSS